MTDYQGYNIHDYDLSCQLMEKKLFQYSWISRSFRILTIEPFKELTVQPIPKLFDYGVTGAALCSIYKKFVVFAGGMKGARRLN